MVFAFSWYNFCMISPENLGKSPETNLASAATRYFDIEDEIKRIAAQGTELLKDIKSLEKSLEGVAEEDKTESERALDGKKVFLETLHTKMEELYNEQETLANTIKSSDPKTAEECSLCINFYENQLDTLLKMNTEGARNKEIAQTKDKIADLKERVQEMTKLLEGKKIELSQKLNGLLEKAKNLEEDDLLSKTPAELLTLSKEISDDTAEILKTASDPNFGALKDKINNTVNKLREIGKKIGEIRSKKEQESDENQKPKKEQSAFEKWKTSLNKAKNNFIANKKNKDDLIFYVGEDARELAEVKEKYTVDAIQKKQEEAEYILMVLDEVLNSFTVEDLKSDSNKDIKRGIEYAKKEWKAVLSNLKNRDKFLSAEKEKKGVQLKLVELGYLTGKFQSVLLNTLADRFAGKAPSPETVELLNRTANELIKTLEIPNIRDLILNQQKQEVRIAATDLSHIHDNLSKIEDFGKPVDISTLKLSLSILQRKIEEAGLTRSDLKNRPTTIPKKSFSSADPDEKPKKYERGGGTIKDTPEKEIRDKKDFVKFLNSKNTLIESIKNAGLFFEISKRLEDPDSDDIKSERMADLFKKAAEQVDSLSKKIPVGTDITESDFDSLKECLLSHTDKILKSIDSLESTEKTKEINQLARALSSFYKQIRKGSPTKKTKKVPKKATVEFNTEAGSLFIKKLQNELRRFITTKGLGGGTFNTDTLKELVDKIPDDLQESDKRNIADAVKADLTTLIKTESGVNRDLLVRLAVDMDIPVEVTVPKSYEIDRDGVYKFVNKDAFLAEIKNGLNSEYVKEFKSVVDQLKNLVDYSGVTADFVNKLNKFQKSLAFDCTGGEVKPLRDAIEGSMLEIFKRIPVDTTDTDLKKTRSMLIVIAAVLHIELPKSGKTPETPTPEVLTHTILAEKADFITNEDRAGSYYATPGFKDWIESSVAKAKAKYAASEIPPQLQKTLEDWHTIYKGKAELLGKFKKALQVPGALGTYEIEDLKGIPVGKEALIRKFMSAVEYGIFEQTSDYTTQMEEIIQHAELVEKNSETIQKLEAEMSKIRDRYETIRVRDVTPEEFNEALHLQNSTEFGPVRKATDDFLEEIYTEYEDIKGSLNINKAGSATTLYKRWKDRSEQIEALKAKDAEIKPMGFLRFFRNRVSGRFGTMTSNNYTELAQFQRKISILRDNRLLPDKEANITKSESEENWKVVKTYMQALKNGTVETLSPEERKKGETVYNNIFKEFASDMHTYSSSTDKGLAKTALLENIEDTYNEKDREATQKQTEIDDSKTKTPDLFAEFIEEIEEDLLVSDLESVEKTIEESKGKPLVRKTLDACTHLTKMIKDREMDSLPSPIQKKVRTISSNALVSIASYLESKSLFDSPEKTITLMGRIIPELYTAFKDSKEIKKSDKEKMMQRLIKTLSEYKTVFESKTDAASATLTENIISSLK